MAELNEILQHLQGEQGVLGAEVLAREYAAVQADLAAQAQARDRVLARVVAAEARQVDRSQMQVAEVGGALQHAQLRLRRAAARLEFNTQAIAAVQKQVAFQKIQVAANYPVWNAVHQRESSAVLACDTLRDLLWCNANPMFHALDDKQLAARST